MHSEEWNVEYTDEWRDWFDRLDESAQDVVSVAVGLLERAGPMLPYPHSSNIIGSRHAHMRELRIQSGGRPFRCLYALDPRRTAILLLGGDKTGSRRWYAEHVPRADRLYDEHIEALRREGRI
jgi:hypothetical protein